MPWLPQLRRLSSRPPSRRIPTRKGLKDGTVTAPGIEFEHVEITPIIAAFRRMCRSLEFDVAEMAITTYLTAKAYNKPFTALPVFVVRQFHHSPIVYNVQVWGGVAQGPGG